MASRTQKNGMLTIADAIALGYDKMVWPEASVEAIEQSRMFSDFTNDGINFCVARDIGKNKKVKFWIMRRSVDLTVAP